MNWEGIAEIDYIFDEKENIVKLLEVNGRFWASLSLSIYAGLDYPKILFKCYNNEDITDKINRKIGMKTHYLFYELIWLMQILNQKRVDGRTDNLPTRSEAIKEVIRSFHPKVKDDVFSFRDPFPGLINMVKFFKLVPKSDEEVYKIRLRSHLDKNN